MTEQSSSSSSAVEKTRQNCNIDWRAQKPSFDEQLAHFCLNKGNTDVDFVFNRGGEITVCLFRSLIRLHFGVLENSRSFVNTFCGLRSV